ncbi:MAG: PHP-associated domain-containing protein [Sulfolobales archaeon]
MSKFKVDPHIHSYVSDGELSPEEVVRYAELMGLNAISITDHDTFLGSYIALRRKSRITVIPGAEFRTELGDVLVLCEHVPVSSVVRLKSKNAALMHIEFTSLLDMVARENCVTIAVHPFALIRKGCGRLFELKYVNCVEVYNSSSDVLTNIYTIYSSQDKECRVSGSDAHILELIGSAYTLVDADNASAEEMIESIRKARVKPYYNFSLEIFRLPVLVRKRLLHSLRVRLGNYGNQRKRTLLYPI